jgi:XTP/dITP diphosphohydrolase
MKKIFLATHNRDKITEIKNKLGSGVTILTLDDYPDFPEVIEDGETLADNALIKARAAFAHTGLASLADDTGLEVLALDGRPGVYSSRYAGENVSYADNVNKLLQEMEGIPTDRRGALFRTVAAFTDGQKEITEEGILEGMITLEPVGSGGFGYDPVFYIPEKKCTLAQLSTTEKNEISHRARALQKIAEHLRRELVI